MDIYLASLPEWQDDHVCANLFGAFRGHAEDHALNWQHKVAFWRSTLVHCMTKGYLQPSHALSILPTDVHLMFRRQGMVPLGLPHVLVSRAHRILEHQATYFIVLVHGLAPDARNRRACNI